MKKLLCIVLAAALVLSLGVGALAYEDMDPPLWQRWGYDSLEEYLADWDETEEEYAAEVAEILAERAEQDAFIATYDPETHDFTPALWEYYEYASKEEMMEAWEIDEAGYAAAVDDELFNYECRDWTDEQWDAWYEAYLLEIIQAEKEDLGLVYETSIMANGDALVFPEAKPVIRNDFTMVPLSVFAVALEAEQSYDPATGAITLTRGDTTMELAVDGGELFFHTAGPDDETSGGIFYLDSLPFVEDGEVYVPLRAVAEALGYDVEWSETYRTAVLVDVNAAIARFDRDFTVMNALMKMNAEQDSEQSYRGESKLDFKVTLPVVGELLPFSGSVNAVVLENRHGAQGTVNYDIAELLKLIPLLSEDEEDVDSEGLDALSAAVDDGLELICDLDSGMLYLRGKLLGIAFGMEEESDANTWYAMDLSEMTDLPDMETLSALSGAGCTFGELIAMLALEGDTDPIYLQDSLDEAAETFAMLADSNFTVDGSVWSLSYPIDEDGTGMLDLRVTIEDDRATQVAGSVVYEDDSGKLDCAFTLSGQTVSVTGTFTTEDALTVEFTLTADSAPAPDAAIAAAPPADAEIVDLFEALTGALVMEYDESEEPFAA